MQRILVRFAKRVPTALKVLTIYSAFYVSHIFISKNTPFICAQTTILRSSDLNASSSSIFCFEQLEQQLVRVQSTNQEIIGYGYCFLQNFIVVSQVQFQKHKKHKNLKMFQNRILIQADYRIMGEYENLLIIKLIPKQSRNLQPIQIPYGKGMADSYGQVQIIGKNKHLSITNGYLVGRQSGFNIIQGQGSIGNLIVRDNKILGVVTHIGQGDEAGFLRVIGWSRLQNILMFMQKPDQVYLGISASSIQNRDGLSIARVASNSPFKKILNLGDIITKVNKMNVKTPQDLLRIVILFRGTISIQIQRDGLIKQINLQI